VANWPVSLRFAEMLAAVLDDYILAISPVFDDGVGVHPKGWSDVLQGKIGRVHFTLWCNHIGDTRGMLITKVIGIHVMPNPFMLERMAWPALNDDVEGGSSTKRSRVDKLYSDNL